MGIKIISSGTLAPWNTKILAPVTRNLEGWFEFDTDSSRIGFNRAPGKNNASAVGLPVMSTNYARFKGLQNFVQTDISEPAELTIFVVGKATSAIPSGASANGDANTPAYVGTYYGTAGDAVHAGTNTGSSLYHAAATTLTGTAARSNGSGGYVSATQQALAGETPTNWGIRVLRVATNSPTMVANKTTGTSSTGSSVASRVPSTNTLRIGSLYNNFAAEVDISQVVIYSTALTTDEINAVANMMRTRASRLGISV